MTTKQNPSRLVNIDLNDTEGEISKPARFYLVNFFYLIKIKDKKNKSGKSQGYCQSLIF